MGSSCYTFDVPALNQHLEQLPGPPGSFISTNSARKPLIQRDAMFSERSWRVNTTAAESFNYYYLTAF